jgi:hypothetical protein
MTGRRQIDDCEALKAEDDRLAFLCPDTQGVGASMLNAADHFRDQTLSG